MAAVQGSEAVTVTLPGEDEILITREVDAPRHLVYRAWTTPELVERWWSGGRGTVTHVESDLRAGGRWHYAMRADDGSDVDFHGEYREVLSDERIVYTEALQGSPRAAALTTVTFTDTAGGGTLVTIRVRYRDESDRDAHRVAMDDGLQEALVLLERTAITLSEGQR